MPIIAETPIEEFIARDGFALVAGRAMRPRLAAAGTLDDWSAFAASWNDLAIDTYMADGGRYRRRRHGVFQVPRHGDIERQPHQPHYQARNYNELNGGIDRWFEPIEPAIASGQSMTAILRFCSACFGTLAPGAAAWNVEVHQFRIEARSGIEGRPTPEGMHRDGVDYVLVLLIDRVNIRSGTTTIAALDGRPLGTFTLAAPFDAALVDDHRVAHGVTPVEPLDPALPAHRDVLVVTFRAA